MMHGVTSSMVRINVAANSVKANASTAPVISMTSALLARYILNCNSCMFVVRLVARAWDVPRSNPSASAPQNSAGVQFWQAGGTRTQADTLIGDVTRKGLCCSSRMATVAAHGKSVWSRKIA